MSSTPTSSAFRSTSPPSRSSRRRSRRARPSRSRPCGPSATRLEIRFPRVAGYRVELPEERLDGRVQRRFGPGTDARSRRPIRSRKNSGIIGEGVDLNLVQHLATCARRTLLYPPDPASALHEMARPGRGAQAPPVRPAQAHHQAMARRLPGLQGRHLSGAAHVSGTGRHGLRAHHRRHHRELRRRAPDQSACSTPTTRPAPPRMSASTPRRPTAGRPTPAAATSTG